MSLVKKLKDILFEEEEYTEAIKVKDDKEDGKIVKIEPPKDEVSETLQIRSKIPVPEREMPRMDREPASNSERELFKSENTFQFPDFDEEEFASSMSSRVKQNSNVLDYERNREIKKRVEPKGRLERVENKELNDKRKFKPSPIISPVYGILNQDYKADDIIKKENNASIIDIEAVRKKAFEQKKEEKVEVMDDINDISEPVVTFFEEKDNKTKNEEYESIDALLESAAEEIPLEDTLEIPKTNNLDAIEEELEKIEVENKEKYKDLDDSLEDDDPLDDTLDSDLFELIDSMYDEREEG